MAVAWIAVGEGGMVGEGSAVSVGCTTTVGVSAGGGLVAVAGAADSAGRLAGVVAWGVSLPSPQAAATKESSTIPMINVFRPIF